MNKDLNNLEKILSNMSLSFERKETLGKQTLNLNTKQIIGSMEMQVIFENVINTELRLLVGNNFITIYEQ